MELWYRTGLTADCFAQALRIIYLHGFASGPGSRKASYFAERLRERGAHVEVPDLAAGDFEHLTISGQLRIVEKAAAGEPSVLIGSSLGGYLAALFAATHPAVRALVLLAPAFHFRHLWKNRLGEAGWQEWERGGVLTAYHYALGRPASISFDLMRDAAKFPAQPRFEQPALIVHGSRDDVVPIASSENFVRRHPNARLVVVDSGHELTDVLDAIWNETLDFLLHSGVKFGC